MKELLEKFFGKFSEGVQKLQDGKQDEAIQKFTEASELTADLTKKADEVEAEETALVKFLETEKGVNALKKYVDMYISASNPAELIAQLKESVEAMQTSFATLQKEKEEDDKTISEAIDKTIDRIEKVEGALLQKVSKQS